MNKQVREFIWGNNLQPGDAIIAKKIGYRVLDHFIIYLGNDHNGHWFMANSIEDGVKQYDEKEVLELVKSFDPIRIKRFKGNDNERNHAIQRALNQEGQPYSLFGSNCEHFANYVQKGIMESPQVSNWIGLSLLAIIFTAIMFNNN